MPSATDIRFKLGAFLAFIAWCVICWALQHAVHYYRPKNRGPFHSFVGFTRHAPIRFMLTIPLLLVTIGYVAAASYIWDINPGNQAVSAAWLYGIGYTPAILIISINAIAGHLHPNEDRELIRQRIERGQAIDAEIGHSRVRKPWWWKRAEDRFLSTEQRLKALTTEIGGGPATARNIGRSIELGDMQNGPKEDEEPFKDHESNSRHLYTVGDSDSDSGRSTSQQTMSTTTSRPQQVKSMLDV
ncbi:hypothetical protein MMC13_000026 [Lambiella insularis]|nr:hypothetical protein [Lambiella insularis]